MFVSRTEVSCRDSIHLDSRVTGANAMSSSDDRSAAPSFLDRTNRSSEGAAVRPGSAGFQSVAGASVSAIATFRGPVRRSRYCASDWRHESAACCRSACVIVICISFSASANVAGATSGPEPAPVPKVGGAPTVVGDDDELADGDGMRHALPATSTPSGARIRNWRRVFIGCLNSRFWELNFRLLSGAIYRETDLSVMPACLESTI